MKAIRLQRFKGYRDSGWIDLRSPIILLLGANSSGKSALLNALLMLKQSLEEYSSENPFVFNARSGVDIGSFEDAVFRHEIDIKKPMIFSFEVEIRKDYPAIGLSAGNSIIWSINVAYNRKRRINTLIGFSTVLKSNKKRVLSMQKKSTAFAAKESFESDLFKVPDNLSVVWSNFQPLIMQSKPDAEGGSELISQLFGFSNDTFYQIARYIRNIAHIGPLRPEPERTYQFTGETPHEVGRDGRDALKILFLDKYSASSINLIDDVNQWLGKMGYTLEWDILKGGIAQLVLTDKSGTRINLKDVGFGISQLLPVLIQAAILILKNWVYHLAKQTYLYNIVLKRYLINPQRYTWRCKQFSIKS